MADKSGRNTGVVEKPAGSGRWWAVMKHRGKQIVLSPNLRQIRVPLLRLKRRKEFNGLPTRGNTNLIVHKKLASISLLIFVQLDFC